MKWIEVEKAAPINGSVVIPGGKNSSLALIPAALLGDNETVLQGIPNIYDVQAIERIGKSIGLKIERKSNGDLVVNSDDVFSAELDISLTSSYRASYYFIGGLLHRFKKVTLGYPGGDNFVDRPIDQHIKVFKSFGATVILENNTYTVEAKKLEGCSIYFDVITSGATINAVLLAALASGKTTLRNCAKDPEIVDVCEMLNTMGAKITGAGTDTISITGVQSLTGCTYRVIPDRLIAGAFLMTVGITEGTLILENVIPEHLKSCISKLEEIGMEFEIGDDKIIAYGGNTIRATRIRTGMYPIFNSDIQQPMTSLLLKAKGKSIIADKVYPHRYNHLAQLGRLGAEYQLRKGVARITGGKELHGNMVHATDVRAGTSLILAGLMAEGVTTITGIEHIERGYEDVVKLYASAGITLRKCEGEFNSNIIGGDQITIA
ncbi:UDP-N-acetylglucosamine 1-carboxyvinyltransferase [Paenibacillus marinisediminis]